VRLKVFVGTMLKSSGMQQGCGIEAVAYRKMIDSEDIHILADVYDRTGFPLGGVPIERAERWAVQTGADGLILTGSTYSESLELLQNARKQNLGCHLFLGGGATPENVGSALEIADGVIVSRSLKFDDPQPENIIQWDRVKVERFMNASRSAAARR
jgi:hypothetical protein